MAYEWGQTGQRPASLLAMNDDRIIQIELNSRYRPWLQETRVIVVVANKFCPILTRLPLSSRIISRPCAAPTRVITFMPNQYKSCKLYNPSSGVLHDKHGYHRHWAPITILQLALRVKLSSASAQFYIVTTARDIITLPDQYQLIAITARPEPR